MRTIIATSIRSLARERRAQAHSQRSRSDGGCDFPRDPKLPPDRQSLFWIPSLQPEAVLLAPAPPTLETASTLMALPHLRDLDLQHADDGWHGVWQADGVTHQFWLLEAPPDAETTYVVTLPLDALFELRAHAARRWQPRRRPDDASGRVRWPDPGRCARGPGPAREVPRPAWRAERCRDQRRRLVDQPAFESRLEVSPRPSAWRSAPRPEEVLRCVRVCSAPSSARS